MPPAPARAAWPALVGLYGFAVGLNLVGIGWGLPGQGRDLLPPLAQGAVVEEADQAWATAQDPTRNLNFGPPAPDRPETPAKVLRRFALYTADPDEVVALMAVARLNPLAGRWDPGFAQYGGFFLYALGGTFKLASLFGVVTLRGDPSFYVLNPERIAQLYLVGRLLVVAVGSLAIPLLWMIARPLYGERTALLAAGLAACAPAWIAWSHVMKPVAFGTPFALAALAVGQRLTTSRRPWRTSLAAGALTGLAAGAAFHYVIVLLGSWIGSGLRRGEPGGRRLAYATVGAAAGALTVLAGHPYWFHAPARTLAAWGMGLGWYEAAYSPAAVAAFAWGSLEPAIGLPLVLAGTAEGVYLAWRVRETLPVIAPAFGLLLAVAVKTGGLPGEGLHARLVLPAALVAAMLAAGGMCRVARALPRGARAIPFFLVIPTLVISGALLRNFVAASGPEGTRHRAGAWINTLPEGTPLGVIAALAPFRSPYFRIDRYRLVIEPYPGREGAGAAPDYFLVAERSDVPASSVFSARYREVQRFAPPALPLGASALAVYPFADPPITVYARQPRAARDAPGHALAFRLRSNIGWRHPRSPR